MAGLAACAAPQEVAEIDTSTLVYPPPPETPRYYYDRTLWSSSDVVVETRTDRLRRFATGTSARGQGFAKPFGVAAADGRVFVSDTVSRRVHALDFPQKRYYGVGLRGVGRLSKPLGVDVAANGILHVCDGSAKRLNQYDLDGNFISAIDLSDHMDNPSDLSVSPDGSVVCIVDTGRVSNDSHGLALFGPNGELIRKLGGRGGQPGQFNLPLGVAFGPDGLIYALDTGNFRVQVFDQGGALVRTFGEAGRYPGQFGHPKGIAVSDDGRIYVSDTSFGVFQVFNAQGRILMSIGQRNEAGGPGAFLLPAGIAVDSDHRIYVADQFFRKIEVFRPAEVPDDWPIGQPVTA